MSNKGLRFVWMSSIRNTQLISQHRNRNLLVNLKLSCGQKWRPMLLRCTLLPKMSPKQTKRSPPASPVRRSRRVARRPPEVDPQQWPGLHDRAKDRVRNYVSASASENKNDGKLISCLIAFLEWLPEGGRESLARDLVECDDDTDVYDIFDNFRTGLVYASKFR